MCNTGLNEDVCSCGGMNECAASSYCYDTSCFEVKQCDQYNVTEANDTKITIHADSPCVVTDLVVDGNKEPPFSIVEESVHQITNDNCCGHQPVISYQNIELVLTPENMCYFNNKNCSCTVGDTVCLCGNDESDSLCRCGLKTCPSGEYCDHVNSFCYKEECISGTELLPAEYCKCGDNACNSEQLCEGGQCVYPDCYHADGINFNIGHCNCGGQTCFELCFQNSTFSTCPQNQSIGLQYSNSPRLCSPGQESTSNDSCDECQIGQYSLLFNDVCKECQNNWSTHKVGSVQCYPVILSEKNEIDYDICTSDVILNETDVMYEVSKNSYENCVENSIVDVHKPAVWPISWPQQLSAPAGGSRYFVSLNCSRKFSTSCTRPHAGHLHQPGQLHYKVNITMPGVAGYLPSIAFFHCDDLQCETPTEIVNTRLNLNELGQQDNGLNVSHGPGTREYNIICGPSCLGNNFYKYTKVVFDDVSSEIVESCPGKFVGLDSGSCREQCIHGNSHGICIRKNVLCLHDTGPNEPVCEQSIMQPPIRDFRVCDSGRNIGVQPCRCFSAASIVVKLVPPRGLCLEGVPSNEFGSEFEQKMKESFNTDNDYSFFYPQSGDGWDTSSIEFLNGYITEQITEQQSIDYILGGYQGAEMAMLFMKTYPQIKKAVLIDSYVPDEFETIPTVQTFLYFGKSNQNTYDGKFIAPKLLESNTEHLFYIQNDTDKARIQAFLDTGYQSPCQDLRGDYDECCASSAAECNDSNPKRKITHRQFCTCT